jgi:aminoglycoside phosphotransferase
MSIGLEAMREATGEAAVADLVSTRVLAGTEWTVRDVSSRYTRLEPPDDWWAVHRLRLRGADDARRELRLALHGVFDGDLWQRYRDAVIAPWAQEASDPLHGRGTPIIVDSHQFAAWFYPFDPRLTTLEQAADPAVTRRLFERERSVILGSDSARADMVRVDRIRHHPEITAVLRYEVETDTGSRRIFAKVLPGDDAAHVDALMQTLWQLSGESGGRLVVPRPLGFHAEIGAHLEEEAPGDTITADRTAPAFQGCAVAAADALAVLHDSDLDSAVELLLEPELERLDGVVEQLTYVQLRARGLLTELLQQIRSRLARVEEEPLVVTHGDLKYDQFIHDDGRYTLTDFEYLGLAETSWDLAKFCAHAVPSQPRTWEDSAAAEEARATFLERYLELRPDAIIDRFPVYEAVHLANRAMVVMWGQTPGWEDIAESLLVLAMERLKTPVPS